MKTTVKTYDALLSESTVDEFSNHVREFLTSQGLPKRDILRHSMTAEEILLKCLETSDGETEVCLRTGTRFSRLFIVLEVHGDANNVFIERDREQSLLGSSILKNLGISPDYSYSGGINTYTFRIRKKELNPFIPLAAAVACSLLIGFLGLLLPDGFRQSILDTVLTPLYNAFLNVLGCIAGPMVFLSVAWGIYGIGDAATLKQIGRKVLFCYISTVFITVTLCGLFALLTFDLHFSNASGLGSDISTVINMILDVFPENIFSPFVNGNTLQIIFLAVVIGIAMLFLGQKTNSVARAVEQINYIVQFLIEFISKLVPCFIFIVLVNTIWSDTLSKYVSIAKLIAISLVFIVFEIIVIVCWTAINNRVSPLLLVKKGLPSFLIALTTASSAAAFNANMTACRDSYGIDSSVSSFGIPLGIVTFMPTTALTYALISTFFAELYGVDVSVSWVIIMIISSVVLALATPPIPGGAMTTYTVLFAELGIPIDAIAIALACDTLFDFIDTGADQFLLPFALLNQSSKLGLTDKKILRSKK